jgi:hypothetical protein
MKTYNTALLEEITAIVVMLFGLLAARPIFNWLIIKLYNLFIGRNHI